MSKYIQKAMKHHLCLDETLMQNAMKQHLCLDKRDETTLMS